MYGIATAVIQGWEGVGSGWTLSEAFSGLRQSCTFSEAAFC